MNSCYLRSNRPGKAEQLLSKVMEGVGAPPVEISRQISRGGSEVSSLVHCGDTAMVGATTTTFERVFVSDASCAELSRARYVIVFDCSVDPILRPRQFRNYLTNGIH